MFDNIKIKALEHKIKSMEKELKDVLVEIESLRKEVEYFQTKTLDEDLANANEKSSEYLVFSLQQDIKKYSEYAKELRVKIAFGKEKLEKMKDEKYLNINTDFNL